MKHCNGFAILEEHLNEKSIVVDAHSYTLKFVKSSAKSNLPTKSYYSPHNKAKFSVKMALNDILKGMPSMDFGFNEFAPTPELDFMNILKNNRVLAVPPYNNVSLHNSPS
jgi:hypothetical protein